MVMFIAGMGMSQIASTTTPEKKDTKAAVSAQGKFVDSNKNGICDNHESKTTFFNFNGNILQGNYLVHRSRIKGFTDMIDLKHWLFV
jgi:hypothetical protein